MNNTVTLVGNLTRDPEKRATQTGTTVVNVGMAVNRRWQNRQNQEWEEEAHFFDLTIWGEQGDNAVDTFSVGDRVIVTGRLTQNRWETEDGEKRSVIRITVDEIGPSLRWATVPRIDKVKGGGGSTKTTYAQDEEPF